MWRYRQVDSLTIATHALLPWHPSNAEESEKKLPEEKGTAAACSRARVGGQASEHSASQSSFSRRALRDTAASAFSGEPVRDTDSLVVYVSIDDLATLLVKESREAEQSQCEGAERAEEEKKSRHLGKQEEQLRYCNSNEEQQENSAERVKMEPGRGVTDLSIS